VRHHVLADERIRTAVDSALEQAIEEQRIVGAVVLASLSGRLVYERAAGLADREAKRPTRYDTIFRWASLTKARPAHTSQSGLKDLRRSFIAAMKDSTSSSSL
jgi:hypothetical protein